MLKIIFVLFILFSIIATTTGITMALALMANWLDSYNAKKANEIKHIAKKTNSINQSEKTQKETKPIANHNKGDFKVDFTINTSDSILVLEPVYID